MVILGWMGGMMMAHKTAFSWERWADAFIGIAV